MAICHSFTPDTSACHGMAPARTGKKDTNSLGLRLEDVESTNNNCTGLSAIFQDNLGKLIPECLHSGFYWSKE